MSKIWFITGASGGFGYAFAKAAAEREDTVIVSARHTEKFNELKYPNFEGLELDVTDRDKVFATVKYIAEKYKKIDVLVSNAGYLHSGVFENITDKEMRAQMETNFFGSVNVIQAVLPYMRSQKSGHIIQTTSIGGVWTSPYCSAYHASKWALEGMLSSLSQEVERLGIKVTAIEPGAFVTGLVSKMSVSYPEADDYKQDFETYFGYAKQADNFGENVEDAAKQLLNIVDAQEPPKGVIFGTGAFDLAKDTYEKRLLEWKNWKWEDRNI